jgi:16S rRNA (guanine(966)-N(2))-methyltransferase RsmD
VREALFSLVGQDLSGQRVLDAFGGTGLLGLEAWSRGARVVVVEQDLAAARAIALNAASLGADLDVRTGDVLALASELGQFDGILVDPPYRLDPGPILYLLAPLARDWLVLETAADARVPGAPPLEIDRTRTYGGTALTVYRRRSL